MASGGKIQCYNPGPCWLLIVQTSKLVDRPFGGVKHIFLNAFFEHRV